MRILLLILLTSFVVGNEFYNKYQYKGPCVKAASIINSMSSVVIERTNNKRPNQIAEVVSYDTCQWCGCCIKENVDFNECKVDTCGYISKLLKPFNITLEVIPSSESWTRFESMHYSMRLFHNQKCQ